MVDKSVPAGGYELPHFRSLFAGLFLLLFGVFFFQESVSARADGGLGAIFSASVVKVIDGDTLEVRHRGKNLRVRLWGIDSPEWQQRFSRQAKEFTRARVQGRRVELRPKTWDKYGRLVAMVEVGGNSLNEDLLREGFSWVHIYYCQEPICREWRRLEKEAKVSGRGLWQDSNPIPPWKWKQDHR